MMPYRILLHVVAIAVMALAVLVLAGWHLKISEIVQIYPTFVPMQYNTALGFLASGAGLLAALQGHRRITAAAGWLIVLLGTLSLSQELLGIDLGIDQVFMRHYISVGSTHPGRLAPNTALCFTLLGVIFLVSGLEHFDRRRHFMAIGAALVTGLSAVALSGYLIGIPTAYGWGDLTRMAPHSAAAFILLGGAMLGFTWQSDNTRASWLPETVGILAATITLFLWQAIKAAEAGSITTLASDIMLVFGLSMAFALTYAVRHLLKAREASSVAQKALAEARRFRDVLDYSPSYVYMKDTHHRYIYANKLTLELFGCTADELVGSEDPRFFPPETVRRLHEVDARAFAGEHTKEEIEVLDPHAGRKVYWEEKVPIYEGAERKLWGLFGISTDITGRKEAEAHILALNAELEARVVERTAQLEKSNAALLQSNMELKHFAHATAHDLQTPLRSIAGFAQLLQKEVQGRGNEQVDAWSAAVVNNTKRLHTLIQDLLSYTRLEVQGLPFEMTDLRRLFDEVVSSLAVLIGETQAEVTCSALPTLPVDRAQLAQVFQNLIENGIKYNRSKPPRVAVAGELQGDQWVFSVTDNGIGIDPKHFDRVFELFKRLHPYHEFPGTGIGVPLCRRIVERHGGHMWIESRLGEGSTFYFSLPVERSEAL